MTKRVFVTGGAGFIGRAVVRQLREGGYDVTAVLRDGTSAPALRESGVRVMAGDLRSTDEIRAAMDGCDAVIHLAGSYQVGIPVRHRSQMYEANVAVARRVLDAAIEARIPRIVDVSTVNVFGDTHGQIVDETYRRDPAEGFLSYYDETKYLGFLAAEARIAAGAPVIIVQPGDTYGPGDHSAIGSRLQAAFDGTARVIVFGDMGISAVHVDDLAAGILAALDRGRIGEAYVLSGECLTLKDAIEVAARAAGREPPRIRVPGALMRLAVPLGRFAARVGTLRLNMAEVVHAADGVTYWASHAKAAAELGHAPRPLRQGVVDAFGHR